GTSLSNIVQFQVVRSVSHTDTAFFDLTLKPWTIGTEITDITNAIASRFGYAYRPVASPQDWDRYDPEIYSGTNNPTGQIFPVNKGKLEVWWSNTNRTVVWPSIVLRYTNSWPANSSNIVIASRHGSPVYPASVKAQAYVQNDPLQPGFNPNEEH